MEFRPVTCPHCGNVIQALVGASSVRCSKCKENISLAEQQTGQGFAFQTAPAAQAAPPPRQTAPQPAPAQQAQYQKASPPAAQPFTGSALPPQTAPAPQLTPEQEELKQIEASLRSKAELENLNRQIQQLQMENKALRTEAFRSWIPPVIDTATEKSSIIATVVVGIILLLIGLAFKWYVTLIMALFVCAVGFFIIRYCLKRISAKKSEAEYSRTTYDLERQEWLTENERRIRESDGRITELRSQADLIQASGNLTWLMPEYQTAEALQFLYNAILTGQATNVQQAIFLYSQQKRIEDDQRAQIQHQQEMERQRQAFEQQQQREYLHMQQQQQAQQQRALQLEQERVRLEQQRITAAQNPPVFVGSVNNGISQTTNVTNTTTTITNVGTSNSKPSNGPVPKKCPMCGSKREWKRLAENREGVNVGAAVAGAVFLGPLGLLAGAVGHTVVSCQCTACGFSQRYKE